MFTIARRVSTCRNFFIVSHSETHSRRLNFALLVQSHAASLSGGVDGEIRLKMTLCAGRITLESESELSEMNESVDSYQMDVTASCQDTPDTDSSLFDELSVASSSTDVPLPEISSGPEDICETSDETRFHPRRSLTLAMSKHTKCIKCHNHDRSPWLLYCRKCFQQRKRFLPPRPLPKRKSALRGILRRDSNLMNSQPEPSTSSEILDQDNTSTSLCTCCMERPSNGMFIHGDIGHQIFCYTCSHRIWLERKTCPYCNQMIAKVVKIFKVEHSFS